MNRQPMRDGIIPGIMAREIVARREQRELGAEFNGIIPSYMLRDIAQRSTNRTVQQAMLGTINGIANEFEAGVLRRSSWTDHGLDRRLLGRGRLRREVWDAHESNEQGYQARIENSRPVGDDDIDRSYDLAGMVYDYYREVHGRDSIDDEGMTLISRVHFRADPPRAFNSAFWDGGQMTYGGGDQLYFNSFVHPFVAGHEFTHGVTHATADFFPWGEAATLNEHVSDAFAAIIEMRAGNLSVENYHWIAVKGIHREGIKSVGLRSMLNPGTAFDDPRIGKDRQPAHMRDYVQTSEDNGGAHINNGIPNRAFALACLYTGGFAWDQMQHIWYRARNFADRKSTFASFAGKTIIACEQLAMNNHKDALMRAWREVGVEPVFG